MENLLLKKFLILILIKFIGIYKLKKNLNCLGLLFFLGILFNYYYNKLKNMQIP